MHLIALTLIVSVATLVLVFIQILIMRSQNASEKRQLRIMEKQDSLMAMQLSRRAELALKVEFKILKGGGNSIRGYTFSFYVHNKGNKSAKDYYWEILMPLDFSQLKKMEMGGSDELLQPRNFEENGLRYSHYCDFASHPVYPTRTKMIGEVSIGNIPLTEALTVLWKFVSEDGAFPEVGYAKLEVSLKEEN